MTGTERLNPEEVLREACRVLLRAIRDSSGLPETREQNPSGVDTQPSSLVGNQACAPARTVCPTY